jgi:hypothetical protein
VYDVNAGEPIAYVQAQARSVPPSPDEKKANRDLWTTDSHALARANFERLVYQCMRELILSDEPAEVQEPTGWKSIYPQRPVAWPPHYYHRGR